jgi:hypothetical protein
MRALNRFHHLVPDLGSEGMMQHFFLCYFSRILFTFDWRNAGDPVSLY